MAYNEIVSNKETTKPLTLRALSIFRRGSFVFNHLSLKERPLMTKEKKELYQKPDKLRKILEELLIGQKYRLDCGHHFTPGTVRISRKRYHENQESFYKGNISPI